ncbi:2-oxoglutarate dehydrogenase, E2 component, dihydrolipoamide succinyltransferase [Nocardioides gansuensis]|uniref:Dihydrolipoamide acetyltransferase component of pyruvate dehydrogenase complex n=1 Tax=Nocardioides gansuensis TaxID=2138300 RepID=A0A2T8F8I2_9ACTN|nr:2-oxoglutarate dehydrogenase, E2 component, dihydrolipoamide succinyltransferase [Nocardioides gansuensis]PVG82026.1 2-oxoglutarate dehydrogenase, E2 component, dihydrolipoamide succinyltransferase [Nocardioides gansuensis]
MASEVTLPALGESVTEGTVTRWLKQIGDTVAVDEPLLEVSTDKVDTEIPSPVAGTLLEIKANEDDTVEVGAVLALVGDAGEGGAAPAAEAPAESAPQEAPAAEAPAAPSQEAAPEAPAAPEQPAAEQAAPAPAPAAAGGGSGGGSGTPVTLPALGESVTEGTVTRWLKQVGDTVAVDEPLLEVSTDKVDTEIPSPVAGTLLEIKVSEDETVEVGAELAVIGSGDAAPAAAEAPAAPAPEAPAPEAPAPAAPAAEAPAGPAPAQEAAPAAQAPAPAAAAPAAAPAPAAPAPAAPAAPAAAPAAPAGEADDQRNYVTPLVRKMAAQHGVDLASISGTGVGGRIRKQDVLDAAAKAQQPAAAAPAAAAPAAAPAPAASTGVTPSPLRGTTEPISRLRKVIATRMVESLQTSAQLTQVMEVDVTNIARLRDAVKADFQAREGVKLTYLPFFAKAAIDALKQHPKLNANLNTEAGEVTYFDRENIAFAVDTEKGLLTPVVKDAGDLSIAGLAKKIADVADRTRNNKITPDDLSGGTFTITNLGSFGALFDTPIINQPQVAILGPGAVVKRPVVIDDPNLGETIAVRYMVYLALTYDHRLVDGADAGRFLREVKQRLETASFEV